jgi:hypothetical protein
MAAHFSWLPNNVITGDGRCSRTRRQKGCQHLNERALARSIGADQAKNFALIDRQRHLIDGSQITKFSSEREKGLVPLMNNSLTFTNGANRCSVQKPGHC